MASSSSSVIMAANYSKYDVFLSSRGENTRNSFTYHLYKALVRAGLGTFSDNDGIEGDQELTPEIERAIKESRASVVVLSEDYATSTRCLDELCLILEERRSGHFLLPVFYQVDPCYVSNQAKTLKIEVEISSRWTDYNVQRWKAALTKVAGLTGLVLSGAGTDLLKKVVDNIYSKVVCRINLPHNLTGMNAHDKEIKFWLGNPDIKVLVICGVRGSGKTTLAHYIISSNWQRFEITSVVKDIGGTFQNQDNSSELFKKFAQDILGEVNGKRFLFSSEDDLVRHVGCDLLVKQTLIFFDDVDEPSQVKRFLGARYIDVRSKVIITTRKSNIDWFEKNNEPRSWWCREYKMQLLDANESLELLSLHAFGFKTPMEGYNELAKEMLQYCEGNPLALEVLGSSLSEDISIKFWRSTLDLLERDKNSGIQRVLVRSYNSLPNQHNKDLFLHIACFFVGEDKDYVEKILEPDYGASHGIKVLTNRCLLSVSPDNKLVMHKLIQQMARSLIHQESKHCAERSRAWLSKDAYKIMRKGEGSKTMEGLALDMQILDKQMVWNDGHESESSSYLKTDSLRSMDNLKLLQLNHVHLTGSYDSLSEGLRLLCWGHFHLAAIPSGLFKGNLVAIDMRYSILDVFEPPIVLQSLKILNLHGSKYLREIHNISRLPNLETLILSDCYQLVHVCENIGGLPWDFGIIASDKRLETSTSDGETTQQPSTFDSMPSYNHLKKLRLLDVSFCKNLTQLLFLPSTLAELYVYSCTSLERITFESHQFTLQVFDYEGCINLSEVEGFIKLLPVAKLDETELGHLAWLERYESCEMYLIGNDVPYYKLRIMNANSIKMLYEFGIMSTFLPGNIKDPNMMPDYISDSPSVSFDVPPCPKNRRLKGLEVTFRYTIPMYQTECKDVAWFAKIHTTSGVDLMYNPNVFGEPVYGGRAIWLSYWPIGNKLDVGDKVTVSIYVMESELKVHECGARLVYINDVVDKTLEDNMRWVEPLGEDLSRFQLSTGAYYLCRREFSRLNPGWLGNLVGDTIDDTEVRGWRINGRPKSLSRPYKSSKRIRCIVHDDVVRFGIMSTSLPDDIKHPDLMPD